MSLSQLIKKQISPITEVINAIAFPVMVPIPCKSIRKTHYANSMGKANSRYKSNEMMSTIHISTEPSSVLNVARTKLID